MRFLNVAITIVALFLFSCSQVKFVPKEEYLVNKVEVVIDNPEIDKAEAKTFVRQKENYKILGFAKFHLMLYNLSSKKKEDDWLKRIGEPPQIYNQILSERSESQLVQYMNNKGYYRARVDDEIVFNEKNRRVNIKYRIKSGDLYKISDVRYHIEDTALKSLYFNKFDKKKIRPGDPFDVYDLEQQQLNIVDLFRDNGYFYFSKDNIHFLADSNLVSKQVAIDLFVSPLKRTPKDSIKTLTPYRLNNFYFSVLPGNTPVTASRDTITAFSDTLKWDNVTVYRFKEVNYPPDLFDRTMLLKQGTLYSSSEVDKTFYAFTRLRQFRFVDIQFSEPPAGRESNLLDAHIRLAPLSKQTTSFDIEGTNTSGNFGVAGNLSYQHRNLFKGAELFQIRFKGATERLHRVIKGESNYFNTRELGVESTLIIPKLLGPGNFINDFERFLPKTVITVGYNYQKRPEYTRTISNFKFGYDWKTTKDIRHTWNLLDLNNVLVSEYDPDFIESIEDLYIKSSFTDHLIWAMNYSLVFNNQDINLKRNYTYIKFNIESAGSTLWAFSEAFNRPKVTAIDTFTNTETQYHKVFNTRFAQYVKTDFEISHGQQLDDYNSIVTRAFVGVGIPFGNFDILPFEKKYFTGGANGIRAWQVRSLGPGSYKTPEGAYPNQSSDIKLEANLEYRFKLTNFLEGALFLDAGNIWAINQRDNREGALFKFNRFYKQIAFGTGTGVRFDLNYFILRIDGGMKLRDPAEEENRGWILGTRPFHSSDFTLSFAIGYPF